jgi:hypothetical protein
VNRHTLGMDVLGGTFIGTDEPAPAVKVVVRQTTGQTVLQLLALTAALYTAYSAYRIARDGK